MIDNTVRNPEPLTGETIFLAYRTKMHRKLDIRAIHYVHFFLLEFHLCNPYFFPPFLLFSISPFTAKAIAFLSNLPPFLSSSRFDERPLRAKIRKFDRFKDSFKVRIFGIKKKEIRKRSDLLFDRFKKNIHK